MKYQLCVDHDREFKDRFCLDHRAVICGVCVIWKHKNCKAIHVSEACKRVNISSAENAFSRDAGEWLKYANSVRKSIDENINKLDAQGRKTLKDADGRRGKLIKQINKSFHDFSSEVTNTIKEQTGKLSGNKSAIDQMIIELTSTLSTGKQTGAVKQNEQRRFLDLHDNAEKLSLFSDKIRCLDMKSVEVKHCFNMHIQPLVKSKDKIGDICVHESTLKCGPPPDNQQSYLSPGQDTDTTANYQPGHRGPRP